MTFSIPFLREDVVVVVILADSSDFCLTYLSAYQNIDRLQLIVLQTVQHTNSTIDFM